MVSANRAKSGYSLIEVLVVLAILGVLATVGVTYRMDRTGPAVKGALQDLHGALLDARGMARASGQPVTLIPSGVGITARLDYASPGGQTGLYRLDADQSASRHCLIDTDGSADPTASALLSLKEAMGGVKMGGANVFSALAWTTNAFNAATPLTFNSNGAASREAFMAVVGQRSGVAIADGPMGILLVNASGNIYRYYRPDNVSPWVRL